VQLPVTPLTSKTHAMQSFPTQRVICCWAKPYGGVVRHHPDMVR
jgi:hypothetical protein